MKPQPTKEMRHPIGRPTGDRFFRSSISGRGSSFSASMMPLSQLASTWVQRLNGRTRSVFMTWLAGCLLAVGSVNAQINYSEDFSGCNASSCSGWTISGGYAPSITSISGENYSSCSGASAKSNIYSGATDATLQATTSLGTSSGLLATFDFDYKCIRYTNGSSANNYATFTVQWATSAGGPWTTAGSTFNSTSHTSCSAAPSRSFTPPAGQLIFVRILAHRNANDFWVVMDNITLTQGAAVACSGTPAPGNTTTTNATPCSGENFTLGTQNATSGSGVTYQWQSSTNGPGGPFNNNGLGTASTQVTSTTVPTWYQVVVSCSGNPGTSTPVAVTPTLSAACYCNSAFTNVTYEFITNVTYGSINKSSGGNAGGPVDYTAESTTVTPGTSQNLTVTIDPDANDYVYAFIDWNQNGILNDAGEVYTLATATSSAGPHTLNITVPLAAAAGSTLMRVMVDWNNASPDPCRSATYGEAENYTVIVEACSGPTPTASVMNDGPVCEGDPINLTGGTDVGNTFSWTGPNGYTSMDQNPVLNTAALVDGGTYTLVVGTMGNTCVSDPASTTVVVKAIPSGVTAGASLGTVCSGSTVDLTGTGEVSSTPLSEDFEGVVPGWTVTNNSTGGTPANAAWALYTSDVSTYSNDNSTFAGANSDSQGFGGTTNTTLNSPVFSLAGMSTATLSFYHYFRYNASGDVGNVQVSTDGVNWNTVQSYTATTGTAAGFTAASLDLSAYAGNSTVQVRFQFLASWGWYWLVDNVSVTASSPVSFSWASIPDGYTSYVQNPTGVTVTESTDYTVTATSNGCSATATTSVNAVPQPDAGIDGAVTLCSNGTPVTLLGELGGTPDAGGTWSGGATLGTFDPMTDAAGAITYTVAPTAPCLNNDQSQVIVTVVQAPNPGQDGSLTVCDQSAPANMLAALAGGPDAGGNWSGPGAVVNNMYDPNTMDPGVYTYTVSGTAPCVDAQATLIVNEVVSPDAGSNGALSVCSGGAPANLFNELGGNPDAGGSWNGPSTVVNDMYDPNTMVPGVYTYTVNPTTPCASAANASVTVTESGHEAVVRIRTDANGDQVTWEIRDAVNGVLATGGPSAGQNNMVVDQTVCLSDLQGDCYSFKLMDSFGDGIVGGGWELRTTSGKLLLGDDFASGANSPSVPPQNPGYGSTHSFCLPEGPANIAPTECGIMNNTLLNKVYCNKVIGASNYQFEFSDPDAGYIRRIARNRNYIIFNEMLSVPLTPGVKYFARVRTDRDGPMASAHFGAGCEMGLGLAQVVPCTELIHAPAYGHSCDETRAFNPPTNNSFIYAKPVVGATEYQFRLINAQEGYDQTFIRSTYILQLKWNNNVAPMLVDGYTYNVQMNVKVNGLYSGFCNSSCDITIDNSGNRPEASMTQANGQATLWPNPVRDGQVNLSLDGLVDTEQNITVDVQDIYGKQVFAKEFGNSGERFTTILDLPRDIASGVYMVNITVNGKRTVQRLSIIR